MTADSIRHARRKFDLPSPATTEQEAKDLMRLLLRKAFETAGEEQAAPRKPERPWPRFCFDAALLGRIDADARRLGISRTAWLHVAANGLLAK
jgi:hypothetical protein